MLISKRGFRIFNEYDLDATLAGQLRHAQDEIEKDVESLEIKDEDEYVERQITKFSIQQIDLDVNNLSVSTSQQAIPAEYFPSVAFMVDRGKKYNKEVLAFHLPFKGDKTLFRCVPSTRILWTEEVAVENGEIIFEIINFDNQAETIQREKDRVLNYLQQQVANVNKQVNQHNESIGRIIKEAINRTKSKMSQRSELLTKLGIPIKGEQKINSKSVQSTKQLPSHVVNKKSKHYDVFICHASEDKVFVNSLALAIQKADMEPWYDDFQLGWGDDLRPSIDYGLENSRFGIVVFSKAFLSKKKWTEYELNGLLAREKQGQNLILPLWYEITREEMAKYSPSLADRIAKRSDSDSITDMVEELKKLLGK